MKSRKTMLFERDFNRFVKLEAKVEKEFGRKTGRKGK